MSLYYFKYVKSYSIFESEDYTKDFKTEMDASAKELDRIIRVNHSVKGDPILCLRQMFMEGLEIGKLSKMLGQEFNKYYMKKYKGHDFQKTAEECVKNIQPERIANNRNVKYQGPDIEKGSRVLVSDFTIKQALKEMADKDQDYMYFERERMEKPYFDEQIAAEKDKEERENIIKDYNGLEVKILLVKAYQLGFSIGEKLVEAIPYQVKTIFDYIKLIADYESGTDKSGFKDDAEKDMMKDYNEKMKLRTPDWEKYKEYFQ